MTIVTSDPRGQSTGNDSYPARLVETGDIFDADDDPAFRFPPDPDDRLWRHPSELAWAPRRDRGPWALAAVSALAGAVLAVGLLAAAGDLGRTVESREVVEREAVRPAVSTGAADTDPDRVAEAVASSIVRIKAGDRTGAGVVYRDDGHVLTSADLTGKESSVEAELPGGRRLTGRVVGVDEETDIAVVKLDGDGPFTPATLGTSDGVAVGDTAVAVGATVSGGVVSAVNADDVIVTDAPMEPGSSGGALLDAQGTVVGITNGRAGGGRMGAATPIDVARAVADDLLQLGHVRVAWIGLRGGDAPDGAGIAVAEVVTGGPADASGLRAGDVVRRIGGHPVSTLAALRVTLRRNHPNDQVAVVYDRDGRRRTGVVVLTERPPQS